MKNAVQNFLKNYGAVGMGVYVGVTTMNITGLYVALRSGAGESLLLNPLERVLGKESETVQKIKRQLGDAASSDNSLSTDVAGDLGRPGHNGINWVREGTYFGIAAAFDSVLLPVKLAVALPLTRAILRRRGR